MKFAASRAALNDALAKIAGAIERHTTIQILSHVLVQAGGGDGGLRLTGTDLELRASVRIDAAIERQGAIALPGATLRDIVRKLADGADVSIEIAAETGLQGVLKSGRSRFKLNALPAEGYPSDMGGDFPAAFELPAATLAKAFAKTSFAISTEETRYYLNGVFIHPCDDDGGRKLRFVSTDGHRLARFQIQAPDAVDFPGLILPRKAVGEIAKQLAGAGKDDKVSVSVIDGRLVRFVISDLVMTSKVIDGTFPDYQRIMPLGNESRATLPRAETIAAIDRVATVASERGHAARFTFADDKLVLESRNPDAGESRDEIDGAYDSEPIVIGFQSKYMAEALSVLDGDDAVIKLRDPGSPALLHAADDPSDLLVVVMPCRA